MYSGANKGAGANRYNSIGGVRRSQQNLKNAQLYTSVEKKRPKDNNLSLPEIKNNQSAANLRTLPKKSLTQASPAVARNASAKRQVSQTEEKPKFTRVQPKAGNFGLPNTTVGGAQAIPTK